MNIAVGTYTSKHGTDVFFVQTPAIRLGDLPDLDNAFMEHIVGAFEPNVDGDDAEETADWVEILTPNKVKHFPVITKPKKAFILTAVTDDPQGDLSLPKLAPLHISSRVVKSRTEAERAWRRMMKNRPPRTSIYFCETNVFVQDFINMMGDDFLMELCRRSMKCFEVPYPHYNNNKITELGKGEV